MSGDEAAAKLSVALTDSAQELLDLVAQGLGEGVTSCLPALVEAFLTTGDVEDWNVGLQDAVQDTLISMALVMEAGKFGVDLRTAAHDLGARMQEIAEGMR